MFQVTITQSELNAYAKKYHQLPYISGYVDIVEALGVCTKVGGLQDEYWYSDVISEAQDYITKEYNFERDILKMNNEQFQDLIEYLDLAAFDDKVHTLAAAMALNQPEQFTRLIQECRNADKDEMAVYFPDYAKELEKAQEDTEKDMRHDFIKGDYHGNFQGVNRLLAKYLDADHAEVNDHESVTIFYNEDELKEQLKDACNTTDLRRAKRHILDQLAHGASSYKYEQKLKYEKRKAEREATNAYQQERKAREVAERHAMLDAIRQ